jgi:hypothetical protein
MIAELPSLPRLSEGPSAEVSGAGYFVWIYLHTQAWSKPLTASSLAVLNVNFVRLKSGGTEEDRTRKIQFVALW